MIAWCEARQPGWVLAQLQSQSGGIDARLRKRYAVPFVATPDVVRVWLTNIVTRRLFLFRGVDPTDRQFVEICKDADQSVQDLKEAADAVEGLFDLPLRNAGLSATAVSKGGPFGYSEASPYVGADLQREIGTAEDMQGYGSS